MKANNTKFIEAHPEIAEWLITKHNGVDPIKKYSHEEDGKVVEMWERNSQGELVNVTARELARRELEAAKEEYEKLRAEIDG